MFRWSSAGESHGESLIGIIEGIPAGVQLQTRDLEAALARRRTGYGRGARQKFEADAVRICSGVRHGLTLGGPIAIEIRNSEWPKWEVVMNPDPQPPAALLKDAGTGDEREIARNKRLTRPRPGHADLPGMLAYRQADARNILERASARETAMRVALGEVARLFLNQLDIDVIGQVLHIGGAGYADHGWPIPTADQRPEIDASDCRCLDAEAAARMRAAIDAAKKSGDTLGGDFQVAVYGLPVGLGSHTQWDQRLDAALAGAFMSIQAVKAVALGDGIDVAASPGSTAHDPIFPAAHGSVTRASNRAGGVEGGMSNGEPVLVRAWLKPISTVPRALPTLDLATGEAASALHQRSDVCAVVPAAVIGEAMASLVIAEAVVERCGGYHIDRVRAALAADLAYERSVLCAGD